MLKMLRKVLVGFAATLTLTVTLAASTETDWRGIYFGGNLGGALGRSTANTSTVFSPTGYFATSSVPAIASTGRQSLQPNGVTAGGQIGTNFQIGSLVLGGEADFGSIRLKESVSGTTVYPCCSPTNFTVTQSIKTDWLFTARARGGFAVGNALVYLTGGLGTTHLNYHTAFTDTFATAAESGDVDKRKNGWMAGGGIEYRLVSHFSVKGEYLYADFGRVTTTTTGLTAFTPPIDFPSNGWTHTAALHKNIFRSGVNYRW
jgi:outer membrane immunogenic protein